MAAATIEINGAITVGDLAEQLSISVTELIGELFKNGIMVTVNEKVDLDTAQIIIEELGLDIKLVSKQQAQDQPVRTKKVTNHPDAESRPPVIAVMGHVDHGKTTLLDAIRGDKVAEQESGGITQHISAYQISHNQRKITFLDTPGHEAFAAIREHGAHLTDLAIIVVAADDGIKPQTLEAVRFAKKAGVKMIVAANKIDRPEANLDRLKQQLAEQNMLPEDWGGDTVIVPVSAKNNQGIDQLLDMVLLMADVEELKAVKNIPAEGLIIESHMKQGLGSIAVALVEEGTIKRGDFIVAGGAYGKVRTLNSTDGQEVQSAGPSTPVVISGFKSLPDFGDQFRVCSSEKEARSQAREGAEHKKSTSKTTNVSDSEMLRIISRKTKLQEFNILIKADVQGSLTSVIDSLKTLGTNEVAVRVVASGVGPINDSDVNLAHTSNAVIYGFQVSAQPGIRQIANRDKVSIREYKIIYELIDDVRQELSNLLAPEIKDSVLGKLKLKKVFKTTQKELIVGGEVTSGKLSAPSEVRILRDNQVIAEAQSARLQRGPQQVKEVQKSEECGVTLKTESKLHLQEGDILEFFKRELIERSL